VLAWVEVTNWSVVSRNDSKWVFRCIISKVVVVAVVVVVVVVMWLWSR